MSRSIVIVFDCLPAHWLGCYGNFDVQTPAFDWLAAQSIVFDRHVANSPHASDAAVSLLAGRHPTLTSSIAIPSPIRPDQISEKLAEASSKIVWLWMDTTIARPIDTDTDTDDGDDVESYIDLIEEFDEILVESLEKIEEAGWLDALLVVTAVRGVDPDQFMWDEGRSSDRPSSRVGHGFTDLRLPLIIRHPEVAGFRLQSITQPIDLVPSLCERSGEDFAQADMDGISLLPLVNGNCDRIRDHGFFSNETHVGIVDDDFVMVRTRDQNSPPELFRQPHDRWMIHDVAVEYPVVVDELSWALNEWFA